MKLPLKKSGSGLFFRIIAAIILGAVLGLVLPEVGVRVLKTFNVFFAQVLKFMVPLLILGLVTPAIAAVAAPGVMGGVLMASVGLVESILGFTPEQTALLMTFYLALDGYGPAANVTGDGAVALALDRFFGGSESERSTS